MLYNIVMKKEIIPRGPRVNPEIRLVRFFNAIIDESKPKDIQAFNIPEDNRQTRTTALGIFVVRKTMDEIVRGTGASFASIYGRGKNNFHDVDSIVEYYSDGNLSIVVDKRNDKGSIILDYPTLEIVNNSAINGVELPTDLDFQSLTRYKLAVD